MSAGPRLGGWPVRAGIPILLGLTVYPPNRLAAQVSLHLAAGIRSSSTLVHDSIVGPMDLRPALAPALLLTARDDLSDRWSADVTLDVSSGGLRRHEGGDSFDAGSATTLAFTVGLRRRVFPGLAARFGVGGLTYAAERTGLFHEGTGGLMPLVTLAAGYAPPFGARRHLEVEARYDLHRFITPSLRTAGFDDPRPVHRLALVVRVGWSRAGGEEGGAP